VDGDVAFSDATGTSHVTANGTVGVNGDVRLSDLALRFDPLQAELARAAITELPFRGTIVGTARLTTRARVPAACAQRDAWTRATTTGCTRCGWC
jgi:hypothetical protein